MLEDRAVPAHVAPAAVTPPSEPIQQVLLLAAPLTVTPPAFTTWTRGLAGYNGTLTISGGTGPYTITARTGLPTGLTPVLTGANTITLVGTPTVARSFAGSLTVADSAGATQTVKFTIVINAPPGTNTPTLPPFSIGQAGSLTIQPAGGTGARTVTYKLTSPLPQGLTVSQNASGAITIRGTALSSASANLSVTVTDSLGAQTVVHYLIKGRLGIARRTW